MATILIIGAGMTGLTAARTLTRQGHTVTVLDKGRGVGGRLATRRLDGGRADHGAPYFSAQDPAFVDLVDELTGVGVVRNWPGLPSPAYVGIGGMNGVAKYLAAGLTVQTNCRVMRVETAGAGCRVTTDAGDQYGADALLLTLPVPQALTLLADSDFALDPTDRTALESVTYRACLAVLAILNRPALLPAPGLIRFEDPANPVALVVDNQPKGTSPDQPALTVYAQPAYSLTRFDNDLTTIGRDLLGSLSDLIPPDSIGTVQVHRWRYSTAGHRLPDPYRLLTAPFPLLIGGDGFGSGGVEGAFLSGGAMSESVNG